MPENTEDAAKPGREPQTVEEVSEELKATMRLNRQKQNDKRDVGETPRGEELKE